MDDRERRRPRRRSLLIISATEKVSRDDELSSRDLLRHHIGGSADADAGRRGGAYVEEGKELGGPGDVAASADTIGGIDAVVVVVVVLALLMVGPLFALFFVMLVL